MQVKFGEFNAVQNEDIQQINPDEIAGYILLRSPTEVAFVEVGGESKVYNITAK